MSENNSLPIITAKNLMVNNSPHIQSKTTISSIMWEVNLALLLILIMSVNNFGIRAFYVVLMSVLGSLAAEFLIQKYMLKKKVTIKDGSAVVTGLLLGFCLPVAIPLWISFVGGFIAIGLGKQVFGGLGNNIFNPAHVARAILLASWPVYMNTWLKPGVKNVLSNVDAITTATPLTFLKETAKNTELMNQLSNRGVSLVQYVLNKLDISFADMFLGLKISGSLGETCKLAILLGGLFLIIRRHVDWRTPLSMFVTVFLGALLISGSLEYATFHILAGGLFLGAFFMATDMVTSPVTKDGRILFGICCGAITLLIRLKGGYPEGVCYSILIMNAFTPLIDKYIKPRRFGTLPPKANPNKEAAK